MPHFESEITNFKTITKKYLAMMNFIRTFVLCSLDIAHVIVDKEEADVRFAMVEVLLLFLVLVFRKVSI